MISKIRNKIKSNYAIYKSDLKQKGIYWSIIHRIYKIPHLRNTLSPIINNLKPEYIIIEGQKLYIDKFDEAISQELLQSKKWESYETSLFKKNIKKDDIVVDVGAHIGFYTILAANLVGKKGKVFAFEPDKKNYSILLKNIKVNGLKNVIAINKAVTAKSGKIKLYINPSNTGDHRVYHSHDQRKFVEIESASLDEYFSTNRIDFIKMDIQGSEIGALKGASKVLSKNKSIKLIVEFWPGGIRLNGDKPQHLLSILKRNKFKLFDINERKETHTITNEKKLLSKYQTSFDDFTNLLCTR